MTWHGWVALLGLAFLGGRLSKRPEVRTETKVVTKEVVKWQKSEATVVATSGVAEKKQSVRVVTRWLRPDGTTAKERSFDSSTQSQAQASSLSTISHQATGQSEARSESRTVAGERSRFGRLLLVSWDARIRDPRPLVLLQGSYQIAGPLFVAGHVSVPTANLRLVSGGASVGLTF